MGHNPRNDQFPSKFNDQIMGKIGERPGDANAGDWGFDILSFIPRLMASTGSALTGNGFPDLYAAKEHQIFPGAVSGRERAQSEWDGKYNAMLKFLQDAEKQNTPQAGPTERQPGPLEWWSR